MNKKLFILVLVAIFSASLFAMAAGETVAPKVETQVILGSSTQVNADFFSGWTNSATNSYLKTLMWVRDGILDEGRPLRDQPHRRQVLEGH